MVRRACGEEGSAAIPPRPPPLRERVYDAMLRVHHRHLRGVMEGGGGGGGGGGGRSELEEEDEEEEEEWRVRVELLTMWAFVLGGRVVFSLI